MKTKITNMIPGRKAKDIASEKKLQNPPEEIEKAEENIPDTAKPENRETPDGKKQKAEARKEFEAKIRGKLKHSR
jgi:hypothetical protein